MAPPTAYTLWQYWGAMAMKTIKLFFSSWNWVIKVPLLILFLIALFNQELSDVLFNKYHGVSRWWSMVIIVIFVVWGLMVAIYKRDRELYLAYSNLEEQYKPKISARIEQTIINRITNIKSISKTDSYITLIVNIRNTGDQTSLDGWKLETYLSSGEKFFGQAIIFHGNENITYKGSEGEQNILTLNKNGSLHEKAIRPILKGAILTGWLIFEIKNIKGAQLNGARFVLSFKDVFEYSYCIEMDTSRVRTLGKLENNQSIYIPGI